MITIQEKKLKELMKSAFKEAIIEDRHVFYDAIADVIEDMAMTKAIDEGIKTKKVSKEKILKIIKHAN